MSQENVEVVRRAWAAFNEGDREGWGRLIADDAVIEPPRERMTSGPATYHGPEGWLEYQAEIEEMLEHVTYEPEEVFEAPSGTLLAHVRVRGSGRDSGAPADQTAAHVYEVREGQIIRLTVYMDRDEARDAVGLRE